MAHVVVPFTRRDGHPRPTVDALRPRFLRLIDRLQVLALTNPLAARVCLAWIACVLDRLDQYLNTYGG